MLRKIEQKCYKASLDNKTDFSLWTTALRKICKVNDNTYQI